MIIPVKTKKLLNLFCWKLKSDIGTLSNLCVSVHRALSLVSCRMPGMKTLASWDSL